MARIVITEQTILGLSKKGERTLTVEAGTIITAAAKDRAAQLGIRISEKKTVTGGSSATPPAGAMTPNGGQGVVAIGSDHGGFHLKQILVAQITELGYKVVDLGTYTEEACDYPDFAYAVARMVNLGEAWRGIMVDSVGVASAMVANKVPGIRAACCHDEFTARSSREHNDANVLTLGGKVLGTELAKSIVKIWLETVFNGGRHLKRVQKISEIEKRFHG